MKSRSGKDRAGSGGFTIVEVATALLLAVTVITLALPGFRTLSVTSDANMEARRIYALFRTARWKAILSGRRTRVLTFRHDESAGLSYVLQSDEGGSWTFAGDVHRTPPDLIVTVTGPAAKVFTPRGTSSFGSVKLQGRAGTSYRLSLNPATGRVRLWRGERDVHEQG